MNDYIKLILTAIIIFILILPLPLFILIFAPVSIESDNIILLLTIYFIVLVSILFSIFYYKQKKALSEIHKGANIKLTKMNFEKTEKLIDYFKPDEMIQEKLSVRLNYGEMGVYKTGMLGGLLAIFFNISFIETNKAIYIDYRKTAAYYVFPMSFISTIIFLLEPRMIIILFGISFLPLIYFLLFPLNQVRRIDKEWITLRKTNKDKRTLTIKGVFPRGSIKTLNPNRSWGNFQHNFEYTFDEV